MTVFLNLSFYLYLNNVHKLDDMFTFIHLEKDFMSYFFVSVQYFVVWILWPELCIYLQGVRLFDKLKIITHEPRC